MTQQQHTEYHWKANLRSRILSEFEVVPGGAAYIPFIGDGDLAVDFYRGYQIFGVDVDQQRLWTCYQKLIPFYDLEAWGTLRHANADSWPFADFPNIIYSVADFDAYSEPYTAFRSFWENSAKSDMVALFFTDGHRQGIIRTGSFHHPSGEVQQLKTTNEKRKGFNFYWGQTVLPWFKEYIKPYKIIKELHYVRGMSMLYWGVIVENVESA